MASLEISRRQLLQGGLGLTGLTTLGLVGAIPAEARPKKFSFVHITDTHIQPELGATKGVAKAFTAIRALPEKPAFALIGGDLVMDAAAVTRNRATMVFDLWQQAATDLKMPLYYSVGNHDIYAIGGENKVASTDPEYGKKMWMKRLGLDRSYNSFDYNGWRFVTLDSIALNNDTWKGGFDADQLTWLDDLLRKTDKTMPMVFLTHVPVFTIFGQYNEGTTTALSASTVVENGKPFKELIQSHNVKAVLQGHTHVVEECNYLGTRYITGGAVCGDWWKGKRLGVHPEGFSVITINGDDLNWKYVPYGWTAVAA